ncbi:hypothetical protein HDV00_003426 [Rhizophlyctis rosea]|nr:hypothetical protein HDV00_003426 [Rhizophlyctis rosea]
MTLATSSVHNQLSHPEPSPQRLAEILTTLGYKHPLPKAPSTISTHSRKHVPDTSKHQQQPQQQQQPVDLASLLEWAFALDGPPAEFLSWLCTALDKDECGKRAVDVLSTEEAKVLAEVGVVESDLGDDYNWDSDLDLEDEDDLRNEVADLEHQIALYERDADLLSIQHHNISQTQHSLERRMLDLRQMDDIASEELRAAERSLVGECGRVDDLLTSLSDMADKLVSSSRLSSARNDPPTQPPYFFQCTDRMAEFESADEELSRKLAEWFWSDDGAAVDDGVEDEMNEEMDRLENIYPHTKKHHLAALLSETYEQTRLQTLQSILSSSSLPAPPPPPGSIDEMKKQTDEIVRACEPLWSELAPVEVRAGVLGAMWSEKEGRGRERVGRGEEYIKHLLSQHARHQYLSTVLAGEMERLRGVGHVLEACRGEVEGRRGEVAGRIEWMSDPALCDDDAGEGDVVVDSRDEILSLVLKAVEAQPPTKSPPTTPTSTIGTPRGGVTLTSASRLISSFRDIVERRKEGEEGWRGVVEGWEGVLDGIERARRDISWTTRVFSVSGDVAGAPKDIYDLERELGRVTRELQPKLREVTKVRDFVLL